jgi:hypothetical protein
MVVVVVVDDDDWWRCYMYYCYLMGEVSACCDHQSIASRSGGASQGSGRGTTWRL